MTNPVLYDHGMKITHFDRTIPGSSVTPRCRRAVLSVDTGNSGSTGGTGGGAPSGPASGDLSGSYPNPTVVGIEGTPVDALPAITTEYLNGAGHWTTPAGSAALPWSYAQADGSLAGNGSTDDTAAFQA